MNQVVSLSGGKDSTAMLLMMLERGEPIHSVVWFDTGWEFPEMHEHLNKLETYIRKDFDISLDIVRLKPEKSFEYYLKDKPVKSRHGTKYKKSLGWGWPSRSLRWCTGKKSAAIKKYIKSIESPVCCIGYAADEAVRNSKNLLTYKYLIRFPLQEYDVTEQQALAYCMKHGFDWGGLYEVFNRVSCFCCPLQRLSELRMLRRHYPELWHKMLIWDLEIPDNRGFREYKTVHDLEQRFQMEDKKLRLPLEGMLCNT